MSDTISGETTQELLDAGRSFGVTKRRLQEWHRAGYLPHPTRHFLGRGRGSVSIYPPGTKEQMLAMCAARDSTPLLSEAAWRVWWERGGLPTEYIRNFLMETARAWRDSLRQLQKASESTSLDDSGDDDDAESSKAPRTLIDRMQTSRHLPPFAASIRKQFRNGRFSTFARVLLSVASGDFAAYEVDMVTQSDADERRIVETGLGLDPPALSRTTRRLAERRPGHPGFRGDSSELLRQVNQVVRDHDLDEGLEDASDEELIRAREEVQLFVRMVISFGRIAAKAYPRGLWGLTLLASAMEHLRPMDQGILLLFWRLFRRVGFGPNMDALLMAAQQWEETWLPIFQVLQQLSEEVPEAAKVVSPQQFGQALRSKRVMEQTLQTLHRLYEENRDQIDAFVAHHPEVDRLLAAADAVPSTPGQEGG
jgi:hypothetical protein